MVFLLGYLTQGSGIEGRDRLSRAMHYMWSHSLLDSHFTFIPINFLVVRNCGFVQVYIPCVIVERRWKDRWKYWWRSSFFCLLCLHHNIQSQTTSGVFCGKGNLIKCIPEGHVRWSSMLFVSLLSYWNPCICVIFFGLSKLYYEIIRCADQRFKCLWFWCDSLLTSRLEFSLWNA